MSRKSEDLAWHLHAGTSPAPRHLAKVTFWTASELYNEYYHFYYIKKTYLKKLFPLFVDKVRGQQTSPMACFVFKTKPFNSDPNNKPLDKYENEFIKHYYGSENVDSENQIIGMQTRRAVLSLYYWGG